MESFPDIVLIFFSFSNHLFCLSYVWWQFQGEIKFITFPQRASLMAYMVKNPPVIKETWVQSLCWEDPLEKRMATHTSILAWRIPWIEKPGGIKSISLQRVRQDWATFTQSAYALGLQWIKLHAPHAGGGPGSTSGQGTRSHMLQLRVRITQVKDPACCN